jgi:hypothetical protein
MGFKEIKRAWSNKYPKGTPPRVKDLDAYDKMLAGDFYDILPHPFEKEKNGDQEIPLYERRPNVQYNMCEMLTHQQASLLFGDKHRPSIRVYDPKQPDAPPDDLKQSQIVIDALHDQLDLDEVLLEAVIKGQSGSVALIVSMVADELPFIDVVEGKKCQPKFNPANPRELIALVREYTTLGAELSTLGYDIPDENLQKTYWVRMVLDAARDTWYIPMLNEKHERLGEKDLSEPGGVIAWREDLERSRNHPFKVVPCVWIRNLNERRKIDGKCTFQSIVDIQVALDYLASQITRGFHYTADPFLAVQRGELDSMIPIGGSALDPLTEMDAPVNIDVKGTPARTMSIPHGAKAELLEIEGGGLAGAKDWFITLREAALEIMSGSKAMQERTSGNPHSGKALEILQQALVWLIERQRLAYGEHGLIPLLRLLMTAYQSDLYDLDGISGGLKNPNVPLKLIWPSWMTPTGDELLSTVTALQLAAGGSVREPRQIAPMDVVIRQALMALGYPDPSPAINQALEESREFLEDKAEHELAVEAIGPKIAASAPASKPASK